MEKLKRGKYTATLQVDAHPLNPRKEFENLSTLVCEHRDYVLGDSQLYDLIGHMAQDFASPDYLQDYIEVRFDAVAFEWLGLLDHSGLHLYLGGGAHWTDAAGWDSGTVGFTFVTREKAMEAFGDDEEYERRAYEALAIEVEEYNSYLLGDVYGYVIRDEFGDEVDSCWGLFGYSNAMSEMEGALEHQVGGEE